MDAEFPLRVLVVVSLVLASIAAGVLEARRVRYARGPGRRPDPVRPDDVQLASWSVPCPRCGAVVDTGTIVIRAGQITHARSVEVGTSAVEDRVIDAAVFVMEGTGYFDGMTSAPLPEVRAKLRAAIRARLGMTL